MGKSLVSELTVVTFKWRGWRKDLYKPAHVMALKKMLKEHLTIPHEFVCVTDDPRGLECQTRPLWTEPEISTAPGRPNSYRRLRLFAPEARNMFGPKVLQMDLDCLIRGNIDHLITDDPFKIMYGKAAPYNGSMWLHKTGSKTYVWSEFSKHAPEQVRRYERVTGVRHYGSDQAWMSFKIPLAPTWKPEDGAYHFTLINNKVPEDARIIFFAGHLKPWSRGMAERCPEIYDAYREHV